MAHIWLQVEPSQVRDIKEWHLVDVEDEPTFARVGAEGSFGQTLVFPHFQFTFVSLLLEILALPQCHCVGVLVDSVLCEFERE